MKQTAQNCHPDLGSHIMIDFDNIPEDYLLDPQPMLQILKDSLKMTDCNICDQNQVIYPDKGGFTILFLLSESHLSIHTMPANKSFSMDFYNCGQNSWKNLKIVEEQMCNYFGWENAYSTILIPRGRGNRNFDLQEPTNVVISSNEEVNNRKLKQRELDSINSWQPFEKLFSITDQGIS